MLRIPPPLPRGIWTRIPESDWKRAWLNAPVIFSHSYAEYIVDVAVNLVRRAASKYKKLAWGWSGGKDSLALEIIMERADIDATPVVIRGRDEFQLAQVLDWHHKNIPEGSILIHHEIDFPMLKRKPELLFPEARYVPFWVDMSFRKNWPKVCHKHGFDGIIVGHRTADGNWSPQVDVKSASGFRRIAPIRHWGHEELMAVIKHLGKKPVSPAYDLERGWMMGSVDWPQRDRRPPNPKTQKPWTAHQCLLEVARADPTRLDVSEPWFPEEVDRVREALVVD